MPFSACTPRSSNARPEPATRSLTVWETSTSPGPASEAIRAPVWTAMPRILGPSSSHSPVWMPARISTPSCRTASPAVSAQRTARAGPSKAARKPSPAVSTSRPRKRSSSRRTAASWVLSSSRQRAAELGGPLGRADDVGEQDGGKHAVGFRHRPCAGQELLDLVGDCVRVAGGDPVIRARKLDELRAGDPGREITALRHVDVVVAGPVEDERRDLDRGEDVPDVDVRVHAEESRGCARARGAPEVLLEVPHERLVADAARCVVLDVLRPHVAPVLLDLGGGLITVFRG